MAESKRTRVKVDRRREQEDDQSWFTVTMEAPLWMGAIAVLLSVFTVIVMWILVST